MNSAGVGMENAKNAVGALNKNFSFLKIFSSEKEKAIYFGNQHTILGINTFIFATHEDH